MKKNPRFDLKKYHFIFAEIGLICSLLFLIAATNINQTKTDQGIYNVPEDDINVVIELPPTIPPKKLPPQKPMIFSEKPDDTVMEIDIPEFSDFDSYDPIIETPNPDSNAEEEKIVDFLRFMPEIIGGQKALYSKIKYPKIAQDIQLEGRVMVQFVVDIDGNVTNPRIIRSVHPELDKEVLRVIKLVKFSPGVQNGRLVKVRMVQSVQFKLKR